MFVKDIRKDFYEVIQHQRVLVLVSMDVDAICACKILQYLFQCDHVHYTIVPVSGKQDLDTAFVENSEGIKFVIMINCGAAIDVVETLQPEEDVVFFIVDSHRPVDVCNIYNMVQVRLLMSQDEIEDLPEYEQLFRDDESEDEDSGNDRDDSDSQVRKRKRFDEDYLERKRDKRLWLEDRNKIMFEYTQFTKIGSSAACKMYELAWKMSKDNNDLLWLAILGVTDQILYNKVEHEKYMEQVGFLQGHVSRLNHKGDDEDSGISVDCLKLAFEMELQLPLYRHWSLFDSLCHSPVTACHFKVWTMRGKKKLQEFLADMGVPLVQCRQRYSAMDVQLKGDIKKIIEDNVEKYGFDLNDMFLASFNASYGFKTRLCAFDVVQACSVLLESTESDKTPSDSFLDALDLLNRGNSDTLDLGLNLARKQLQAVVTQVQSFLDMNHIVSAGPFLYTFVQEGTPDAKYFSHPICLQRLANFTLQAYMAVCKNRKHKNLPLVMGVPLDTENGTSLVIGIPPIQSFKQDGKNFFGKAFDQAASSTNSRTLHNHFDEHVIEMKTQDKSKFFDALISILQ